MDIKNIHKIFIGASILLSVFFSLWSWDFSVATQQQMYKVFSICSGLTVLILVTYWIVYLRKLKSL